MAARYRFVVAESLAFPDAAVETETAGDRASVELAPLETVEDVRARTTEADAVFVTTHPLDAARMDAFGERVRAIGRIGIGLDAIDLDAARERGLAVIHAPGYATNEVATHTAMLILAAHRRLPELIVAGRGTWSSWTSVKPIEALDEATLGLIGGGRIGAEVARLLEPFVGRILVHDPYMDEPPPRGEAAPTLAGLLAASDIISLHLPLTDATRGLIDADAIASMKPGAIIANTARGALIDSRAAADALHARHLGGVAVDVLESEQPAPDHPLLGAPRAIVTPHAAWYSERSARDVRSQTVEDVIAVLAGGEPIHGRRVA